MPGPRRRFYENVVPRITDITTISERTELRDLRCGFFPQADDPCNQDQMELPVGSYWATNYNAYRPGVSYQYIPLMPLAILPPVPYS